LATDQNDDTKRVDEWLAGFGGRVARPQTPEERKRAIAEMCAAGADRLFPLLVPVLMGPDPEARCAACEAVLRIDARGAIELVLPLLNDPDRTVRWQACGCLHDFGDERAVVPLIRVLQGDPDPQVRNTAAYALGGIGSPAAIPALLAALESDHELDELGYSTSSSAKTALDDILGTNETRIRFPDGLCKMQERPPDLERLKRLARETYEEWSKRQAEADAAADGGDR
jgi:HEAT repeat protein